MLLCRLHIANWWFSYNASGRVLWPRWVSALGVLAFRKRFAHRQKRQKSGPEAEKRPAERPNGDLPENRSYPELPQDVRKL